MLIVFNQLSNIDNHSISQDYCLIYTPEKIDPSSFRPGQQTTEEPRDSISGFPTEKIVYKYQNNEGNIIELS